MRSKTMFILAAVLFSFTAQANLITLTLSGKVSRAGGYVRPTDGEFYFLDSKVSFSKFKTKIRALDSRLSRINKTYKEKTEDHSVIGKNVPGYEKLQFQRGDDGKYYLLFETEVVSTDPNMIVVPYEKQVRLEVEFVAGSWAEYLAGKDVALKATRDGEREYLRSLSRVYPELLKTIGDEVFSQGIAAGSLEYSNLEGKRLYFEPHLAPGIPFIQIKLNLKQVDLAISPYRVKYTVLVDSKKIRENFESDIDSGYLSDVEDSDSESEIESVGDSWTENRVDSDSDFDYSGAVTPVLSQFSGGSEEIVHWDYQQQSNTY